MQESFVLRTLKKAAAIGAGVAMLGATLTSALALDLANGVYDNSNAFVVGHAALASDVLGAVDIAMNLQYEAKTATGGGTTLTVTGGEEKQIPIGFGISNSSVTEYFDTENQDDEIESLFDGKISFKGDEYDTEEVLRLPSNGPVIVTGVDDDDYTTEVRMEVQAKDRIQYFYKFSEAINLSEVSYSNPLTINFLGKQLKIVDVPSDSSITAYVGEEFFLNEGDSVEVEGKTVKLLSVGSDSIMVEVDGVQKSISSTQGTSEYVNGLEITVDSTVVKTNVGESSAILVIGTESSETYENGDAYIGEDEDDPNWVWKIAGLDQYGATDSNYASTNVLGVENDFIWNKLSDNPPTVGECINLPNDYLSVCIESLSVQDDDYMELTMDIVTEDLSDSFGSSYSEAEVLKIEVDKDEGLYLQVLDKNINVTTDEYVKTIYLYADGTNSSLDNGTYTGLAVDVFYVDPEEPSKIKYYGATDTDDRTIAEINFKDTTGSNAELKLVHTPNGTSADLNLTLDVVGKQEADCPDGSDDLYFHWKLSGSKIYQLGYTAESAEAEEVAWGPSKVGLGEKDDSIRTHYGIIIETPESNGDNDMIKLKIPSDQVFANVILKGTEIADPTDYNLILIGGPCANPLVEKVFDMTCDAWPYEEGEGIIKLAANGDKVAMLVAGTTALDTRRTAKAVAQHKKWALSGTEVVVKGTSLNDITVETT